MEQSPSREASSNSATQEILRLLWKLKVQYSVCIILPAVLYGYESLFFTLKEDYTRAV